MAGTRVCTKLLLPNPLTLARLIRSLPFEDTGFTPAFVCNMLRRSCTKPLPSGRAGKLKFTHHCSRASRSPSAMLTTSWLSATDVSTRRSTKVIQTSLLPLVPIPSCLNISKGYHTSKNQPCLRWRSPTSGLCTSLLCTASQRGEASWRLHQSLHPILHSEVRSSLINSTG